MELGKVYGLFCMLLLASVAPAEEPLSLAKAEEIAFERSPLLRVASSQLDVADARLAEARAAVLPVVGFSESFQRSNNPVFVFGSLLEQGRFGQQNLDIATLNSPGALDNFRTAIEGRVPLFNQLQTVTGVQRARLGREGAVEARGLAEQRIRLEIVRAYFGVLVAREQKRVADDAVQSADAEAKRIRDFRSQRMVTEADVGAAEVQLAEFRQQQIEAEGNVAVAAGALNIVLGLPVDSGHEIAGAFDERSFELPPQDALLQQALDHRPDYRQAALAVAERDRAVTAAYGQYLPRVDLSGSFGQSGEHLGDASADYAVGARLSLGLFDWARRARLSEARAARATAEAERQRKADEISLEVVRALEQYRSARARTSVAAAAAEQAHKTLRIVDDRYQLRLVTITELLRAQNALVRARMTLAAARYEQYVGYAQALFASGTLHDLTAFES